MSGQYSAQTFRYFFNTDPLGRKLSFSYSECFNRAPADLSTRHDDDRADTDVADADADAKFANKLICDSS